MNAENNCKGRVKTTFPGDFARALGPDVRRPPLFNLKQEDLTKGLAKLVLGVLELLKELLERQAVRRVEAGSLTKTQTNNMGLAFMKLNQKLEELRNHFGLTEEDLNIDLGPLGKLLKD